MCERRFSAGMWLLLVTVLIVTITQTTTAFPTTSDLTLKKTGNFGPSTSLPTLVLDEKNSEKEKRPDDYDVDENGYRGEMLNRARSMVFRPMFAYREKQAKKQRIFAERRRAEERRALKRRAAQQARRRFSGYSYSSPYLSNSGYPSYYPKWYVNAPFSYTL